MVSRTEAELDALIDKILSVAKERFRRDEVSYHRLFVNRMLDARDKFLAETVELYIVFSVYEDEGRMNVPQFIAAGRELGFTAKTGRLKLLDNFQLTVSSYRRVNNFTAHEDPAQTFKAQRCRVHDVPALLAGLEQRMLKNLRNCMGDLFLAMREDESVSRSGSNTRKISSTTGAI